MVSSDEGMLTLSIAVRVSPEPETIELLEKYRLALNYDINKILGLDLKTIKEMHRELYRELGEWLGLPSKVALDLYRDELVNVDSSGLPHCPQMTCVNTNRWGNQ